MKMIVPPGYIEGRIHLIRGLRIILDFDLAVLYGVETRSINQQVARNRPRFPGDFMFVLNQEELDSLRSQNVILKKGRGGHRKYPPKAFTEQGVAMLSGILNSPRAVAVNVEIMRAFVRLRALITGNRELSRRLEALEQKYEGHDVQIRDVFNAIRRLMDLELPKKPKRIGFV